MQFITEDLEARFAEVGDQSDMIDPIVIAKYDRTLSTTTWLMTQYLPEQKTFIGYRITCPFDLYDVNDKENVVKVHLPLKTMENVYQSSPMDAIFRDATFTEATLSKVMNTFFKQTYKTLSDMGFTLDETPVQRNERFIQRLQEIQRTDTTPDRDNIIER